MYKMSLKHALALILVISACAPDDIVQSSADDIRPSEARNVSGPTYTAIEIAPLSGDVQTVANGVNDLGYVVGNSYPPNSQQPWYPHAFIRTGSGMTTLSATGTALAVAGATTVYVAGQDFSGASDRPVRWTFDPANGSSSQEIVDVAGTPRDINSAGTIIGTTGNNATLWPLGGSPVSIPPASGYDRATGRGINDAGYMTVTFHGSSSRGYALIDGISIELPPASGHTMTFAGDISEPVNGIVYVSGVSAANVETDYHLARWKIDLATHSVLSTEAISQVSEGRGVSNGGTAPGQIEGRQTASTIAWTLNGTVALKPTKGGSNPNANGISANGRYIVGDAFYKGFSTRGLLWSLQ